MQEIIDKIIERLRNQRYLNIYEPFNIGWNEALRQAIKIIKEVAEEYNGGWIPCSERLPEERDWYLAVFEEPDTGFILVPFIADYLMGKHTRGTTEDGWIIANCTDVQNWCADYYKKLKCIAWQPLPKPYQSKGE